MIKVLLFICLSLSFGLPKDSTSPIFNPISVPKKTSKKIYAHLMPWFETKQTNEPAGTWGSHWTMANQNPDSIASDGRRQIASHYYPLTGPYASGDPDIIEYQLLLMKYSGIDGVCIDWPGITPLYDYPMLVRNTEKIISMVGKVGLHFAIVYEDQDIDIAFKKGIVTDKITAARNDMRYLQTHYFTDSSYERFGASPLLLDFGPQTFMDPGEWANIFSVLPTRPSFFTLWDHEKLAGSNATGAFAWINADHLISLRRFYSTMDHGPYIASAYPGFHTFYAEGGWGGPTFTIAPNHLKTFNKTLDLALESSADYIQVPTWNDYGEGTMIEPTLEFQYGFLTTLQRKLGVPYSQTELELIAKLYKLRKQYAANESVQKKLDDVLIALASLQTEKATTLMNKI
jgi:hypothetical protein